MDAALGLLTFGTIGFMVAFGYLSTRAIEKRREERHEPSTLCSSSDQWKQTRVAKT